MHDSVIYLSKIAELIRKPTQSHFPVHQLHQVQITMRACHRASRSLSSKEIS